MAAVLSVPGINSLRTNNGSLQGSLSKLFFIRVTSPEKTRASVCLLLNPKECCFQSCVLRGFASIVQVLFTEHRYCYYKVHACSVMSNSLQPRGLGSSLHGFFQARILEQVAIFSSRGSS